MLAHGRQPPDLPTGLDAVWDAAVAKIKHWMPRTRALMKRAAAIEAMHGQLADRADARLREDAVELKELFRRGRDRSADVDRAVALVWEAGARQVGDRAHLVQIATALALSQGMIAELATGEGKTLSAAIYATIAGWRGKGCHVVTMNDYLVQRDAQWMGPLYRFCGVTVAHVEQGMDPAARRAAYAADVTYVSNKEVAADFLRDQLILGRIRGLTPILLAKLGGSRMHRPDHLVLRGLECAIIDEADSIMVDEAVTPLIISGNAPNPEQVDTFQQAAAIARQLEPDTDYKVLHRYRDVDFTRAGRTRIAELTAELGGVWSGVRRREELVHQALCAREMYLLDKQYVIQDGKVVIVDEFTGRLMPDRHWRDGLHQAVEAKENLEINPPKATLARISFQRFFRLYKQRCGMTGTAWEVRHEMWQVYRSTVARIPTHKPCIRRHLPDQVFARADQRWAAIVDEIQRIHERNQPILVGTRSVGASELLSQMLTARELPHVVLNAVRQEQEAQIVRTAGQSGRITVATNMAGRGTDIVLGQGVAELGGLRVIATERHESGRIDRQLFGRAARQGDPGVAIAFVSLEDELVVRYLPGPIVHLFAWSLTKPTRFTRPLGRMILYLAQQRAQFMARRQRKSVLKTDDWLNQMLGFAGAHH